MGGVEDCCVVLVSVVCLAIGVVLGWIECLTSDGEVWCGLCVFGSLWERACGLAGSVVVRSFGHC